MGASVEETQRMLDGVRTIAIIGLSEKPDRASYEVAKYLEQFFRIVPVNPNIQRWEGRTSYPNLAAIPESEQIDLIDIFRKSSDIPSLVDDIIASGVKRVWLQLGVTNPEAEAKLREQGITVVSDACLKVSHGRLSR